MFRSKALRPIAGVVLVTFSALTLQPLTAAAQLPSAPKRAPAQADSGEERFSRTLNEIHEILKEVVPQAAMPHKVVPTAPTASGKPGEKVLQAVGPKMRLESERAKPLPGVDVTAKVKALRGKYKDLKTLEAEVSKGFKETEKHIHDKNLPAEILARHEAAVAEYDKRKTEFSALMQAVEAAADGKGELQTALSNLGDFMAKYPNAKTHTPTDPNNLPWGSPKPVTRAPYTSPAQFKTSRLFGEPVKVAQAGSLSGISLPSTVLPTTPMPADTAPTEDVQITQAIRDLATSLGNNPVKIYNWVRNNIAFIPSYGSIQGSDMTLQTKRGNSFDTASLLIALLRSAGVPARYVYGTIEVPADKAMNWVGGVTVPQAAQNLMGQGGIPNIGVGFGGQVRSIRLEHVWVEAFVDYVPSRGAVNRSPNTWVPIDASFKQYQFTQGTDIESNVPFDAQSFMAQLQQGATVNLQEGWTLNVNQDLIHNTLTSYETRVANYSNAQNPSPTPGDLAGTQRVGQENRPILLGTLPYTRIATGAKFQAIPDNLRWKFRYNVYASDMDLAFDSPTLSFSKSTPNLSGKKITLSFSAATPADQAVINSSLPPPHADGTPTQPTELPQNLPGYLIHLIPELRVDGEIVATGSSTVMGTDLIQISAAFNPASGQWEAGVQSQLTAGEYIATALDLQGTNPQQVANLRARLQATKDALDRFTQNPSDLSSLQGVTRDQLTGDLMYSGLVHYYAAIDIVGQLAARRANVVTQRMPSFGNFGIVARTQFSFGIPRRVGFPGMQMDIVRVIGAETAKGGDNAQTIVFRKAAGALYSAYEGLIPELLFTDQNDPNRAQGMSAVKLLALAASQGQRIYILNPQNQGAHAQALAQLTIDFAAQQDIANALAAGKEVTFHPNSVTASGFTGAGYIIMDQDTGAAAYKISGGANGGFILMVFAIIIAIIAPFALISIIGATTAGIGLILFGAFLSALSIASLINTLSYLEFDSTLPLDQREAMLGTMALLSMLSSFLMVFGAVPAGTLPDQTRVYYWISSLLTFMVAFWSRILSRQ